MGGGLGVIPPIGKILKIRIDFLPYGATFTTVPIIARELAS